MGTGAGVSGSPLRVATTAVLVVVQATEVAMETTSWEEDGEEEAKPPCC